MPSITIRDVPKDTHRELASRAALSGQSLQEYLRTTLMEMAEHPEVKTLMERAHERVQRLGSRLTAEQILAYRDEGRH